MDKTTLISQFNAYLGRLAELRAFVEILRREGTFTKLKEQARLGFLVTALEYVEDNLRGVRDRFELGGE